MDYSTIEAIVKAMFTEMDALSEESAANKELYETEKARRKAAERERDYWRELANDMSEIADKYAEQSQEPPF